MNDYMIGRIDACAKLAATKEEFLSMVKKATGLKKPTDESYVIERAKDFN